MFGVDGSPTALRFAVQGLGLRVKGWGFTSLGVGVEGFGFRVKG